MKGPRFSFSKNFDFACHCCLLETEKGLVLIDSGFSQNDLKNRFSRLGAMSISMGEDFKPENSVFRQVQRLGFKPEDVQHIVLTHMDPDHMGGVEDFPWAQVHVSETEYNEVQKLMKTTRGKNRFHLDRFQHPIQWNLYSENRSESWKNLKAISSLKGLPEEILLVPLHGHTPGHCGVAVDSEKGWILHAGDSYFKRVEISDDPIKTPVSLQLFLAADSTNNKERFFNLSLLQKLRQSGEVQIFSSHDPDEV